MNLLPDEEKIIVGANYRRRLLIVSGLLFFIALLLALTPVVASYFLVSYKIQIFEKQLSVTGGIEEKGLDPYINIIESTNRNMALLDKTVPGASKYEIYDLLRSVSNYAVSVKNAKGSYVTLNSLSYEYRLPGKKEKAEIATSSFYYNKIALSGKASDRNTLQGFIQSLKNDPRFSKVESPISNFIASKDIDFSLILSLKN